MFKISYRRYVLLALTVSIILIVIPNRCYAKSELFIAQKSWSEIGLGKIIPPAKGMYLGQTELTRGDVFAFESAIDRKVAIIQNPSIMSGQEEVSESDLVFDIIRARELWTKGYVLMVGAYEAYPGHKPFTVDKLIRGAYDRGLKNLAAQFKEFGKPMFFTTAREPNGVLANYMGGFGPNGDKNIGWAAKNGKIKTEFKPPIGPSGNPNLFVGLGSSQVCDGIERLAAAQRYYYDFFHRREGIDFLTFDTMGWAVPTWETDESPCEFEQLYTLIRDYSDWISINYYMVTEQDDGFKPEPTVEKYLSYFDEFIRRIRKLDPIKPVLITELGFSKPNISTKVGKAINSFQKNYPEIKGIFLWGSVKTNSTVFSYSKLIRSGTPEGNIFKKIVNSSPDYFHSFVNFKGSSPN